MKKFIIIVFASLFLFQALALAQFEDLSGSKIPNVKGDWGKWKRFGDRGWVETNRLQMSGNILRKRLLEHPLIPPGGWLDIADNFDFNENAFTRPDGWFGVSEWRLIVKNENLLIEEYSGADGSFWRFEWRRQ